MLRDLSCHSSSLCNFLILSSSHSYHTTPTHSTHTPTHPHTHPHLHIPTHPPHPHTDAVSHPTALIDALYYNEYHSFPSSGSVGRSATFCALCSILERMKSERVVDIFTTVHAMRARLPRAVCSTVSVGLSWGLLYGPARCMCRAFGALSTEIFCACCAPMTTCVPTGTDNMLVCYRKCMHSGTWRTATLQHQHKRIVYRGHA